MLANQRNRIPFVGIDPNVLLLVKQNAITTLKNGVSDDHVAQAKRVGCKGLVTTGWTRERASPVELSLPQCTARSINNEEVANTILGQAVRNQVLAACWGQRESAAEYGDGPGRDNPGLPSDTVSWHNTAEGRAISHRLHTKYLCTVH